MYWRKLFSLSQISFMKLLFVLTACFITAMAFAQTTKVSGVVTDSVTHEFLSGVMVVADKQTGTITDDEGKYSMDLGFGNHTLVFSYVGYNKVELGVAVTNQPNMKADVEMSVTRVELNLFVVTGSKYEKKISEETVSMEVLKPQLIENTNSIDMEEALNKVPGVNVIDGQANIRGGSGYAYGAGSRVLVLVDDLPQLSADANDVKWEFLPIENLDQVEVIKGASSVLYGSSALNGVINIRTAYPTSKPLTKISFYNGIFDNPKRDSLAWWGNHQPFFNGGSFLHTQKFGQFDLVLGGNVSEMESYLDGEYFKRGRINANTRYRFKNIDGLSAGINTNMMRYESGTFFIWADADSNAFQPFGGFDAATTSLTEGKYTRFNLDPFITYFAPNGDQHSIKSRYFYTNNDVADSAKSASSKLYYADYQYQKHFPFGLSMVVGLTHSYSLISSGLYGDHDANNNAVFAQFEQKIKNLTVVGGMRYEMFRIDTVIGKSQPVFRTGLNFQLAKATYVRASFGQGYRFPSVAEKFTRTNIGSIVVFPNPGVQPETGQSAELGIKQGFKIDEWMGYIDVAAFANWYQNFMEFRFGYYPPFVDTTGLINPAYLGFKSLNIENARITGTEISITSEGKLFGLPFTLLAGYTYINPIDVDAKIWVDSILSANQFSQHDHDSIFNLQYLKYRYKQTVKLDADITWKKFSTGVGFQYNSFMINIDPFFEGRDPIILQLTGGVPYEFVPGIHEYRMAHNKGDYVMDWHLAWQISDEVKAAFIVKNITNNEYTLRPAMIEPPRNFTAQISIKF